MCIQKILLFFLCLTLTNVSRAESSNEESIQQVLAELASGMSKRDIAAVMNVWSDDAEVITLAGGVYRGTPDIKALFAEAFANRFNEARYLLMPQYFRFDGDSRVTVDGVWKSSKAGPSDYPSCGLFIYQLRKNSGKWKIYFSSQFVPRQGHTAEHGRTLSWLSECKKPLQ